MAKEFRLQPSEIDNMQPWEYELFMQEINELVKAENEKNKQEMDKAGVKDAKKMANPNTLKNMQQNAMPKMPTINMPSVSNIKL